MSARVTNLDSGTHPAILHHNGGDKICRRGLELKRHYFDLIGEPGRYFSFAKSGRLRHQHTYRLPKPASQLERLAKTSVVTFTSYRFPGSAELSLNHFGVPIDVIRPPGVWRNIRKLGLLRDYLEAINTDYVIFLDSHDTFVTSDVSEIVSVFESLPCRALFQADGHDWPSLPQLTSFYDGIAHPGARYRYLCSGIFIGERDFLKRMIARAIETPPILEADDQGVYKKVFAEFYPDARLDYACELFQSLTDYVHPTNPMRFEPVPLHVELQWRQGDGAEPETETLPIRRTLSGLRHRAARSIDPLFDWIERGKPAEP